MRAPPPHQTRGLAFVQVALLSVGLWLLAILFVVDLAERAS